MVSHLLVPQAKFKSLTVVSTFKLGTEKGSVLQLTEAPSWSEVGLEPWKQRQWEGERMASFFSQFSF